MPCPQKEAGEDALDATSFLTVTQERLESNTFSPYEHGN
jgi:hypothetical protein